MDGMTTTRTLLLIRHAETDFAGTFCGHSDPPVNERGRSQIERLVLDLQQQKLDAVYSSDLQRALTTAEALAASLAIPLRTSSNLREIGFGDWEGFTWEQTEKTDPAYAQRWVTEFPRLPAPNGEEFDSFTKRTLSEFDTVALSNQNAAIVTHAGVLRVILTRRCGLSDDQAWQRAREYCGIFTHSEGDMEQ
jgi:alpha-ribazole phosphatase